MKIGIIIASVREERVGDIIAHWVHKNAVRLIEDDNVSFELLDLKEYNLPPVGTTNNEDVEKWMNKMNEFDSYIYVLPEYNRAMPGYFKNALDYLYKEVENKPVAFVAYGGFGGLASIASLRPVIAQQGMFGLSETVNFLLRQDFKEGKLVTNKHHENILHKQLRKLVTLTETFNNLRKKEG